MEDGIKIGSLFSGIGGIELGFQNAKGFKTSWFIEKDLYCQTILRKRFPKTTIYEDITKIDFRTIPKVDILTGGFPCQDISNAGKRVGIKGSRSGLWTYFIKAIRILRPKIAFIENVSALTRRGLSVVLCDLAKIGYDAEWYCVPASAIGALHKRDRIFIIAYSKCNGFCRTGLEVEKGCYTYEKHASFSEGSDVSNTYESGQSGRRKAEMGFEKFSEDVENSECHRDGKGFRKDDLRRSQEKEQTNKFGETSKRFRGWWAIEPELGRVAHGVPNRVDRIRCLGNAVVPQLAEVFAKAIKEKINFKHSHD